MIRGFEKAHFLPEEQPGHLQWAAALEAGLIAGVILLVVPRGSPWSALTFFSPTIMGRALVPDYHFSIAIVWCAHLAVSVAYGLIIARAIASLTQARAILLGGLIGLLLYGLNWVVVGLFFPAMRRGNELSVLFTHIVFGLIASGAYRGLLKRKRIA